MLTFKGKIWGIAEHTDVHPTETHLPAIPGVCPAVPLAKVAVRDIARRLSHRTAATPRAQKTWLENNTPTRPSPPDAPRTMTWASRYCVETVNGEAATRSRNLMLTDPPR